jgi:tripartite-type tricarboxylate transporter receptor subunit TctC
MAKQIASDAAEFFSDTVGPAVMRDDKKQMTDWIRPALVALAVVLSSPAAGADDEVESFYRGKTLQFTSAFAEGGLYSTVTRLVAEHLPRHLPGRPNGIAVSLPGAAGLRQMSHLANVAAKDGTVVALMYDNVPTSQVMQTDENIRFDARRFGALGSVGRGETALISVLKRSGVATLDDARVTPLVFGATGTSSGQFYLPHIMNKLFGTRFKIIPGYKTAAEIFLSMERGEIDAYSGAYEAILEGRPQWIAEHRFNWLAQLYDERPAQFADVPLLQELAQSPLDRGALRFLALARIPGKILLAPPGVPPARLAALRAAFAAMVGDPAFVADVGRTSQRLEPRTWQDAERVIRETVDTPPDVIAHVRELMKVAP